MNQRLLIVLALALLSFPARGGDALRQPPAGFTTLFNGKNLDGWNVDEKQATAWKVEDGTIHYVGKGGKNLATTKDYHDFELWLDWKITKGGDSGIYLRGKPQVQIWDNKEGSGALFNNPKGSPGQKPLTFADHAPGEWNTFYIKMVGAKVTVKLNDKLVVDGIDMLEGKVPPSGAIELQVHGTPLWFRNVFIKELGSK